MPETPDNFRDTPNLPNESISREYFPKRSFQRSSILELNRLPNELKRVIAGGERRSLSGRKRWKIPLYFRYFSRYFRFAYRRSAYVSPCCATNASGFHRCVRMASSLTIQKSEGKKETAGKRGNESFLWILKRGNARLNAWLNVSRSVLMDRKHYALETRDSYASRVHTSRDTRRNLRCGSFVHVTIGRSSF